MSWLFGYGNKGNQPPPDMSQIGGAPPPDGQNPGSLPIDTSNLSKQEKKVMEAYRFDSSALERAAQAAKDLEKSSKRSQKWRLLTNISDVTCHKTLAPPPLWED